MLTFIKDKNGRYDAENGKHDDLLFSDMIADAISTQQSAVVDETKVYQDYDDYDDYDDSYEMDLNSFFN